MNRCYMTLSIASLCFVAQTHSQGVILESGSDQSLLLNVSNTGSNWKDGIWISAVAQMLLVLRALSQAEIILGTKRFLGEFMEEVAVITTGLIQL